MLTDGRPGEHLLTVRLITARRPDGSRAGDGSTGRSGEVARPRVSITQVTIVNSPGPMTGFSIQHAAVVTFFTGAAAGSVATLLTLLTTGLTVRSLLTRLARRRNR
jgi:hypothetical protein